MKLENVKLVVVTGAGSGIGRVTAQRFARLGARVVASDINAESAEATAAAIREQGGEAYARHLDVTDVAEFEEFADWVRAEHGVCDVVVNNAGIGILGEVIDTTEADWDRIIGINLLGMVHGARLFAKQMIDAGKPGHVVNIASAAAFLPMASLASYSTTKYAVKMFTDCIRAEFAPHRIGASVICPGPVLTNIFASATHTGASAEDAQQRSSVTGAAFEKIRSLHLISGPENVAKAIEGAVRHNRKTVLVRPEAYLVYAMRRLSPALLRTISGLVFNQRTVDLLYRLGKNPRVARLIGA
ncbi:SDR family NAD(P)-dependent oxidoreductase [Segniliparus rugosus]|uniref:Uncharacterized protein n=1 Tax=Segniliparus rugosus (strain ATCC BAA-974 / DSM 45345 / CCUG 50838 / CIP 108380 / JCM 13579 / CDC 945) TaxID=679197 RepID=E5XUB7_SEGRC|nr:SDR family NAD(P)-dependent oxidoreductase [Segniliparus rugosus]EFV12058.1 hypothetical protein HMPREF9336_03089 [Segniliparus rugosus ATCC BAA-974]